MARAVPEPVVPQKKTLGKCRVRHRHSIANFTAIRTAILAALPFALAAPAAADPPSPAVIRAAGAQIFKDRCAGCHDAPGGKAPSRAQLGQRSVEDIAKALLIGPMAPMAHGLTVAQVGEVAMFVSQKVPRPDPVATANMCASPPPLALNAPQWNGWGRDGANSRFQPTTAITPDNVGALRLKWAFSYPGDLVYGQPTVIGDRVFVTSLTGRVQALDARTGCTIWTYEAGTGTRTAISVAKLPNGTTAAFFGGENAVLHAVDANTGKPLWELKVESHPAARITGTPAFYANRLYVPVASSEEVGASAPYQCCTFRGSVVAVDAATGKQIWKTYAIAQAPKPYAKASDGTQLMGPAGASIWSAPTIDAKRNRLYVGTGNSYTGVPIKTSDSILALDLKDGHVIWGNQVTTDDNFLVGCYPKKPPVCMTGICNGPSEGECPAKVGPDHDFGASPILATLPNGHRILVAGQKSAVVWGLDPDQNGKLLWKARVGVGGPAGGVEWGMAADTHAVYAPSSDIYVAAPDQAGGITALALDTGKQLWHVTPKPVCDWGPVNCWSSQSQAVTALPGLLLAGGLDGHVRALRTDTGAVAWDFDAGHDVPTVNQGEQSGGSFNVGGPTVVGGMVFVNAGYGRFAGQNGHVLLAFAVGK
jgi:polyvinyl alcohol dehydrogenase (cytochrome)